MMLPKKRAKRRMKMSIMKKNEAKKRKKMVIMEQKGG